MGINGYAWGCLRCLICILISNVNAWMTLLGCFHLEGLKKRKKRPCQTSEDWVGWAHPDSSKPILNESGWCRTLPNMENKLTKCGLYGSVLHGSFLSVSIHETCMPGKLSAEHEGLRQVSPQMTTTAYYSSKVMQKQIGATTTIPYNNKINSNGDNSTTRQHQQQQRTRRQQQTSHPQLAHNWP